MMPKLPEPDAEYLRDDPMYIGGFERISTDFYTADSVLAIQEEAYRAGMAAAGHRKKRYLIERRVDDLENTQNELADSMNSAADRMEALEAALRQAQTALINSGSMETSISKNAVSNINDLLKD